MLDFRRFQRFIRFLMVGVVGFVVDAGISELLVRVAHATPLLARLPAFAVASVVTFSANRHYTFGDRQSPFFVGWIKYISSTSIGAAFNYAVFSALIVYVIRGVWAVPVSIAIGSVVGLGFNYLCSVHIVFAGPRVSQR